MKICAMSDMHGKYPEAIEKSDICLIGGDITPLNIQSDVMKSRHWFINTFIPWCHSLDCEKVIFVGGNHDRFLDEKKEIARDALNGDDKVVYLECNTYDYNGFVIYGTPLCKEFGHWWFMLPQETQEEVYNRFLDTNPRVDLVLSHDAPYGRSDLLLEKDCPWYTEEHLGNDALARFISSLSPRYVIHGHLHSSNHDVEMLGTTEVYNVSLLGEDYRMKYEPLYLEV